MTEAKKVKFERWTEEQLAYENANPGKTAHIRACYAELDKMQDYYQSIVDERDKQAEQVKALAEAGSPLIRMLMVNRPGLPDKSKPTVEEFTAALDAWEKSLGLLNDGA